MIMRSLLKRLLKVLSRDMDDQVLAEVPILEALANAWK